VLLTSWSGETSSAKAGGALVAINELLLLSPVLVQAYDAAPSRAAQVSFPLRAADLHPDLLSLEVAANGAGGGGSAEAGGGDGSGGGAGAGSGDASGGVAAGGAGAEAVAARVVQCLRLQGTFGFVQLVRLSGEWVPLDLHLGLPLFDVALCEEVCSSIQRDGLLREAAAPALAAAAEGWLGRVIDFAGAHSRVADRAAGRNDTRPAFCPAASAVDDGAAAGAPLPLVDLIFDGASIGRFDEAEHRC